MLSSESYSTVIPAHIPPSFPHIFNRHPRTYSTVIPAKAGILYASIDSYLIEESRIAIQPSVYLLASKHNGTLYIGVTGNLVQRIWQHRNNSTQGFTQKYHVHKLVYYEIHNEMTETILREKRLKKWNRRWKVNLIEAENSNWTDHWNQICQ